MGTMRVKTKKSRSECEVDMGGGGVVSFFIPHSNTETCCFSGQLLLELCTDKGS